ncbi:PREDICTED: uncharacterized protein LOC109211759 [Nicotiana attenuata]|uniref:uncharacterized protein LOC109211759 n=1 Tax=Nicotiana attenuata TaxID=49451 RepID=UPI0009059328|nr:PREDICTED: uncharacterized protein LOC109211759 [Nicotiana attenuata]
MSNPQDNPDTPPQPTSSDSSTPPQPSTTPHPRRRCVKMIARKNMTTGALSKRLNAQLKASQAQESEHSDDSFKSASEREGTGSSDSEKIQTSPFEVRSVLVESVENRFVLVSSVRNVEMPELRRRGGKNKIEKEESEGASCDVRGTGIEVVDSSPTSKMVRPAICGTEDEIVGESGKKTGGSGSGEAVEGLVNLSSHVDEPGSSIEETLANLLKKVGASYNPKKRRTPTPKVPSTTKNTKKRKANSPTTAEILLAKGRATRSMVKQSERSKAAEPLLSKRTRSAVKNKQVRIGEDEEWSGEEESDSDCEQDKLAKISACQSAKEIWEALQTAHEGITQVNQSKIYMLTAEYDLFRMKDDESIQDMHTRFTSIINELHSLGKQSERHYREKDLQELTIDELVGNLKTYEMKKKKKDNERRKPKRKKNLVLKTDNNDSSNEDGDMAYLTRRFQKMGTVKESSLQCCLSVVDDDAELWHRRLGHASFRC